MLSTIEQLRLYLRDRPREGDTSFFLQDELEFLLNSTASIEEAASLGWLLKAGTTSDAPTTVTIGQMSETRGQATESFNICMSMYRFWLNKANVAAGGTTGVARWMNIRPDEGSFVGDLFTKLEEIEDYFESDVSRLTL